MSVSRAAYPFGMPLLQSYPGCCLLNYRLVDMDQYIEFLKVPAGPF
jgi:hypothetical protein